MASVADAEEVLPLGPGESIQWLDSEAAIRKAVEQTKKPILIYVTSAECNYCERMERETWSDKKIVTAVNSGFVPLRVDAEKHPLMIEQLQVRVFPSTMIVSREGRSLRKLEGFMAKDKLIDVLQKLEKELRDTSTAIGTDR